jgi:hypothetical protein
MSKSRRIAEGIEGGRQRETEGRLRARFCVVLMVAWLAWIDAAAQVKTTGKPTESQHQAGPDSWEGWTLSYVIPDLDPNEIYPMTLVLAHKGHVVRRIAGAPFIWEWIFWSHGQQVAYATGPLHFGMQCVLIDIRSSHELGSVDCFHDLPAGAPDWARRLVEKQTN